MNTEATLLWGVFFGGIGVGYFIYGKRQSSMVPLICGVGLMAFPYFVSDSTLMVITGAVLMAVPYFLRL